MTGLNHSELGFAQLIPLLKLALADQGVTIDGLVLANDLNQATSQSPSSDWSDCLVTAGPSSRLRCRLVSLVPSKLEDLSESGSLVVCRSDREWVSVGAGGVRYCQTDGIPRSDKSLPELFLSSDSVSAVIIEGQYPHSVDVHHHPSPWQRLVRLMRPEWPDIVTILVYSVAIALLTLAIPVAVESMVNTVAFGRQNPQIIVLSLILLGFLTFSAVLRALQSFVAEIIQRRIFVRVASDVTWRLPRIDVSAVESQNMTELVNRFFDVVTVQKVVTTFLLDGIGIALSTLIGMIVLAFYHPWLLAFDLVLLVAILFILTVLGLGAVKTSIKESKYKYATAEQLEEIARCPLLFKGQGGAEMALLHVDIEVANYLDARKKHFRVLLRQSLSALMLQAVASTVLLALGGWLVITGQLTLGQLIAAELIVTVIVSSVAKFGKHLESFYDLMASIDKLGYLFDVPVESSQGAVAIPSGKPVELSLAGAHIPNSQVTVTGGKALALVGDTRRATQKIDELFALRPLEAGLVALCGVDLREIRPDLLRRDVGLLRSVEVINGTLAENVIVGRSHISHQEMWKALKAVGLEECVNALPQGTRCRLGIDGTPLSRTEVVRLCLARAIVGSPRLLLIDGALDALSDSEIETLLASEVFHDPSRVLVIQTGREKILQACDITLSV